MDEQHRGLAPCPLISAEQGAQTLDHAGPWRVGVSGGARRADAVAAAATAAEKGIDPDHVTIRLDCACRTNVEAAGATRLLAARMGAEIGLEIDIEGLFEFADHIGEIEKCPLHGGRIAGVRPEIAVPLFVGRKERGTARKIENEIGLRGDAVLRLTKGQIWPRRHLHRGEAVDRELEAPEMAAGGGDPPFEDRHVDTIRREDVIRLGEHQGDRKP